MKMDLYNIRKIILSILNEIFFGMRLNINLYLKLIDVKRFKIEIYFCFNV